MSDEVHARIAPSMVRRVLSVAVVIGCGLLLIFLGVGNQTTGVLWKGTLIVVGAGLVYIGDRMRLATANSVELTDAGLRESSGQILCAFDDIEKVERGAFAFKPSNGLLVLLKQPGPAGWAPGLWWRYGRRIGIGGVTPPGQSKAMADIIGLMRMKREGLFGQEEDDA